MHLKEQIVKWNILSRKSYIISLTHTHHVENGKVRTQDRNSIKSNPFQSTETSWKARFKCITMC